MPTLDRGREPPEVIPFRHLGRVYTIAKWWSLESGCAVSPVAGEFAMVGVLRNAQIATSDAIKFMARWVR